MKTKRKNLEQKVIRLEPTMVRELEHIQKEVEKNERVSFSALVRRLIRLGLDALKPEEP